ncbi:hypothetical protein UUU_37420 [Klebsiella pneumoniae subsp. pneumoniae DSM 30104 = JCM 1662 = NBRC 14940]|nr:hypothetical protein UUU_37420 [Klebsiella pneumoniae subsp. pneumoniae DSM 30104 = JCM 1662 = NBRC 14940]
MVTTKLVFTSCCLASEIVTCEASTLKANAAAYFISFSVAMGGLATQPINNSARQVLIDISRIFIISSFL